MADATSIGIGQGEILDSILHYGEEEIDVEAEEGRRGQKARADVFVQHNVLSAQRRSILPSRWQKWRHRGISLAPPISLCVFPTTVYRIPLTSPTYYTYVRGRKGAGGPFPLFPCLRRKKAPLSLRTGSIFLHGDVVYNRGGEGERFSLSFFSPRNRKYPSFVSTVKK